MVNILLDVEYVDRLKSRIAELTDELSLATVRAASRLTRIKELETALHLAEEKQE